MSSSEIQEIEKEIGYSYQIKRALEYNKFLGINKESKENVSIALINTLFNSYDETAKFLKDLQICSKLNHENIVPLINLKTTINSGKKSLIVITEMLDADLYQIIFSEQELTVNHRRFILYQILRGLKYLHSTNIAHANLKPSNIIIKENCDIKIQTINTDIFIHNLSCRWHKAPEILLLCNDYPFSNDIWCVGLILYELIMRKSLFTGRSDFDQLHKIVDTIGSPKDDDLFYLTNQNAIDFMKSLPKVDNVDWNNIIPNGTSDEIDLIKMMITWNPTKRISVEEALKHAYFEDFHDISDEPCSSQIEIENINPHGSNFDFKNYFWNEIQKIREDKKFK